MNGKPGPLASGNALIQLAVISLQLATISANTTYNQPKIISFTATNLTL